MSRSWTAMKGTPGITYIDRFGNPYRADDTGIVHVLTTETTAMAAQAAPAGGVALATATATQVGATWHKGAPLIWLTENY